MGGRLQKVGAKTPPRSTLTFFSWYKKNKPGGRVYLWGGSMPHHLKTLRTPRYEHYDIRYQSGNVWAFMGGGRTKTEMEPEGKDLAPYIRNEDSPWISS
jgi:hypothetical protein